MEFVWHDGGRAASGYIGSAGDCVARAIAIATGAVYRDVYAELGRIAGESPRGGVTTDVWSDYLTQRGWQKSTRAAVDSSRLPSGVVLLKFESRCRRSSGHLSCLIDHTVYDTWNPFEDDDCFIVAHWTLPHPTADTTLPIRAPACGVAQDENRLTQDEYERILKRVRALHRTASNHASTEGEVRNALRAMQSLMLTHNLSRRDIVEEEDVRNLGMTRRACPLNGQRTCAWESSLAYYLVEEIFTTVQYYADRRGKRTLFWFYGPVDDVQQALGLFREMLLTIATAARIKYGGYSRGSGASYAEGYVHGLPRQKIALPDASSQTTPALGALIQTRMLAVRSSADEWLQVECGVQLRTGRRHGRIDFDHSAHQHGKRDGAQHERPKPHGRHQITHRT